MGVYLLRRLVGTIPIVFGVALIVFILFNLIGGDPTYQMLGKHANAQQIAELRHELGIDQPLWIQFVQYLKQIVTFDFGRSYANKQDISQMIREGVVPSLFLAIPAFTLTTLIAIVISLFVSYFRGSWIDRVTVVLCVLGMSVPVLAYILFGQFVLAFKLSMFPVSGYANGFSGLKFVILPVMIWVLVSLGIDVRFFRTAILDEVNQDYVRTARAKGLSEVHVFFKHVLKNSMIPILTYLVIEIPFLILGSFLLEGFFGIPGLGSITIDALRNSDFPVLKAMTTVNSLLYIVGTLATDFFYTLVDPRVSLK